MPNRESILLICGGGGFSWEGKVLAKELVELGNKVVLAYPEHSYEHRSYYEEHNAYLTKTLAFRSGYSLRKLSVGFIYNYKLCRKILNKENCDIVIGVGTSNSIPMLMAATLMKKRSIFIESVTRTREVSRACVIISRLHIADTIYVQWPRLEKLSKNYIYAGNIL